MPKYIKTDKSQDNIFIPLSLSKQIQEGTFEYTLSYLIDNETDMNPFEIKFKNDKTGRPAWDPRLMLKIVLFAYSRGEFTSRAIQRMCRENVVMMALSENTIPDFTVIADFIAMMSETIIPIFVDVLLCCDKLDLLGHTTFALDGCKMSSNAAKEYSGTMNDFRKKKEKLGSKLKQLLETHRQNDKNENDGKNRKGMKYDKRIDNAAKKIRKKIKKIKDFIDKNGPKPGSRGRELKSNITDNESAKMKTSHGTLQGYNGQAMVDEKHQIIVAAEAFGNGQDAGHLEPMLENVTTNMIRIGKDDNYLEGKMLLADTGYNSEENLKTASKYKADAYIPDTQFRKRDPRFAEKDRFNADKNNGTFKKKDFIFDEKNNIYLCPSGKIMKQNGKIFKINDWSYIRYASDQKECSLCKMKKRCLRKETTKRRTLMQQIKVDNRNYSQEMLKKMSSVKALDIYSKRMQIVEPVFGNIRHQKKLNRFTLRGKKKVNIQWLLFTIVHNIEKIAHYGDLNILAI